MTLDPAVGERLKFLVRVVQRQCEHLRTTDARIFATPFTADRARALASDPELSERVEAFVSRFARLQDTLGDKLLPTLLHALGETPGAFIDALDRAERLGLIRSADEWLTTRHLRNQMVHEYVEDPAILADALQSGHELVALLTNAADAMISEAEDRNWT